MEVIVMCEVKKYPKELENTYIEEKCILCGGSGEHVNDYGFEGTCPWCKGEGVLEVELRACPECGEVYSRNDFMWVNDRYGIPYKNVCIHCHDKVQDEILEWEYDYMDAGEYLEEEW
jgi:RecJ-like exonuclease